ncbi:tetratricopeptide repeat protein [Streptomyces sp. NPDC002530]
MNEEIRTRGEALVAAALAGDGTTARRHTDYFVLGKRVDEGIPYWERAVEAGDAFSHYTLARYRKIRGDRRAAEALYRAAADRHAGCAYGLGSLLREDRNPEAAEWFRRGWEEWRHLDCKIELGKLMAAEGRPAEASAFLMSETGLGDIAVFRWSQLFDSFRETFDRTAAALDAAEADGDEDAAEAAVRILFDLDEHFADYPGLAAEADALYGRGAALSARAALFHAMFLVETDEDAWPRARAILADAHERGAEQAASTLGINHEKRGELAEAERAHLLAVERGEEKPRWNLALLCKRQGRYDDAERWFREIGEDDKDAARELDRIARFRSGDLSAPDADDLARLPALRERAEAGDLRAGYEYAAALNDWDGSNAAYLLRWMEPAAEAGDQDAAFAVAGLYEKLRRFSLRDAWRRRAADAGHLTACSQMAWLSDHHHDYQEAERWFVRAAAAADEDDGQGLYSMLAGKLMAQRGAYAEAEPFLRTAWEEGEDLDYGTETAGYYGLTLHRLGRSEEAIDLLESAVLFWDEEVRRRYNTDDLDTLARMIDPEEILEEAKKAVEEGADG